MFTNLKKLYGHRLLIETLVVRELKARYRGSVLGYFWSFLNPVLLLLVYSFVFTVIWQPMRGVLYLEKNCSPVSGAFAMAASTHAPSTCT